MSLVPKLLSILLFISIIINANEVFAQLPPIGKFDRSAQCNRNVNCVEGYPYRYTPRNSTIMICTVINGQLYPIGTGTIIHWDFLDVPAASPPYHYMITANHLFTDATGVNIEPIVDPQKWVLIFNYQQVGCESHSIEPSYEPLYYSVQIVERSYSNEPGNDWALLRIDDNLEGFSTVCMTGWDIDPTLYDSEDESTKAPLKSGVVHHPMGDIKKVSKTDPFIIEVFSNRYRFTNSLNSFWKVTANTGFLEGGSSGSSLVATADDGIINNREDLIIGICNTTNYLEFPRCTQSITGSFTKTEVFLPQILQYINPLPLSGLIRELSPKWFYSSCMPGFLDTETCFDNMRNQEEDAVDCCEYNTGCTVCPPCRPPVSSGGGQLPCRAVASEIQLLDDCYNGTDRYPKVRFRINSNCLGRLCLQWKEAGQINPDATLDINGTPQVTEIHSHLGEFEFSWDFHGGLPPSFPVTKTYTLYIYDEGCFGTPFVQVDFPVTIYGSAVVNAGNDLSLCVNQTEQLNGQFQGGNYYTNAFWRAMPSQAISYLSNPNIVNPILTPTQTGTYTYILEIRDAMNCSGFDEIIVRVDNITRPAELRLGCVIPPDYYHAGRIYTAEACSTTITAPEPTDFVGAQEVNLLPGFTASAGATFTARIAPCDVDENAQAPPPEQRTAQKAVENLALKPNSFSYDLFPNPTDGMFTLRYTSTDARLVNVRLYDNIGRLLTETSWQDQNRDFEIDISRYSAGLYHIYVSDGRQTVVKKLFKR